jgi:hypothetical protein
MNRGWNIIIGWREWGRVIVTIFLLQKKFYKCCTLENKGFCLD